MRRTFKHAPVFALLALLAFSLAAAEAQPQPKATLPQRRLSPPPELPGAGAPPLELPPLDQANRAQRNAAIDKIYPALPALEADLPVVPGPEGRPLSLADLEALALQNSPLIRQAAADVTAAKGAAISAGLYPNPTIGYQADNIRTGDTGGYQGGFIRQTIKTPGKLWLARQAALADLGIAEQNLRKTQIDLLTRVRTGYFAVLVARENVRVSQALAKFTDEVYRVQVEQLKGGEAAAYEPMQLRILTYQARIALDGARNRHGAAWRQLSAALVMPQLPPTELVGQVDMPIPLATYPAAMERIMRTHTDLAVARDSLQKAELNLKLARITPLPDVELDFVLQKDYTIEPFNTTYNLRVGVPIPLWDRNQGGILQAQANLARARDQETCVKSELTARLAEIIERYDNNRVILGYYGSTLLPDQIRVYRGVYARHQQDPEKVDFNTVVTTQQNLVNLIAGYVDALNDQWSAVVDLADILQADDLFQLGNQECVPAVPELEPLPPPRPAAPPPEKRVVPALPPVAAKQTE